VNGVKALSGNIKVFRIILLIFCMFILLPGCGNTLETADLLTQAENELNAPEPKPENGQLVFRLADYWPADYPPVLGDKEFARLVEERSGGKLKIIVYSDAVLGDEQSVIEQVQLGGIDFARVNSAPLAEVSKKLGVVCLPYLFRDSDHLWKVLLGPIGDELLDSLKPGRINGLAYYDSGARSFYSKTPVYNISQLKGLRIRVQYSDPFSSFIKLLGATPVQLNFGDVYNALQKDEIDGAENNWSSYYTSGHYRLAGYYLLDEHTRNPEVLLASSKVMDSLSAEYREIITSSAKDSVEFQREAWKTNEKKSEDTVRKFGAVISKISESDKESIQKTIQPMYEKYGKEYKDLIERIQNTK
jgi:tripartite ATP-independent transporter DctP family solute receptor